MAYYDDPATAPNISGAGNYAQMLSGLFRPPQQQQNQPNQQQQNPFRQGLLYGMMPKNPDGSINWASILGTGGGTQNQPNMPGTQPINPTQPGVPQPWQPAPNVQGSLWG